MFKSIFVLSTRLFSQISQAILLIIQTREQKGRLGRKIHPSRQFEENVLSAACRLPSSGKPWIFEVADFF